MTPLEIAVLREDIADELGRLVHPQWGVLRVQLLQAADAVLAVILRSGVFA